MISNGLKTSVKKICSFLLSFSLIASNFFYVNPSVALAEEAAAAPVESASETTVPSASGDVVSPENPAPSNGEIEAVDPSIPTDTNTATTNDIQNVPPTETTGASAGTTKNAIASTTEETSNSSSTEKFITDIPSPIEEPSASSTSTSSPDEVLSNSTSTENISSPDNAASTQTSTSTSTMPEETDVDTSLLDEALKDFLAPDSTSASSTSENLSESADENTATSSLENLDETEASSTEEILPVSTTTKEAVFASTTEISTKTAELILPEKLSSPIVVRYRNRTSGTPLEVSVINASSESTLSTKESNYFYEDTFKDTDLKYEVTENGIKESIILKNVNHPTEFKYQINLDRFDVVQTSGNRIDLYKKGELGNPLSKLYTLSAPKMVDSNGQESTDIIFTIEDSILILTPDANWLSQASYPVIIDPTIEITVLNVHSHPVEGEYWNVDFVTSGAADLKITPADQATVDDMQFTSLFCGSEDRTSGAQILEGDVIYYPNWSCDEIATASHLDLKTGSHHLIFEFSNATEEASVGEAFNTALIWTGASGDGKFSTAANWSPNKVPSAADTVTFDNTCTNCNVTIDVSTTTSTFTMAATYTGTITMAAGVNLTVAGVFSQSAGTFVGNTATTTFSGNFAVTGGTFNAATTTYFAGAALDGWTVDVPTSLSFHNFYVNIAFYGPKYLALSTGDTLTINGLFKVQSGYLNGGTIKLKGDARTEGTDAIGGTTVMDLDSSSVQTITINGGQLPYLRLDEADDASDVIILNASGGFSGATTTSNFSGSILSITNPSNYDFIIGTNGWQQAAGTFTQGPWNLTIQSGFAQSGGTWNGSTATTTIQGNFTISGGTYNAATTTQFTGSNATIDVNTSQTFYDLVFYTNHGATKTIASGDTFIVNRKLWLGDGTLNAGTVTANGDIIQESSFDGGTSLIDFGNDSLVQTWTVKGGSGPIVRFNSVADADDSIVFNAAGTLYGLIATSSFSGAIPISNPDNYDISIGNSSGWVQTVGNFTQGNYNLTISTNFTMSGGTWTGSTATTTFSGNFAVTGGTFNAATTTYFAGPAMDGWTIDVPTSLSFHNFYVNLAWYGPKFLTLSTGDTLTINGLFKVQSGYLNGGTIKLKGDARTEGTDAIGGTTVMDLDSSSVQTITINGGQLPYLRLDEADDASDVIILNASGGFSGATTTSNFSGSILSITNPSNYDFIIGTNGWQQAAGTFTQGPWNLTIQSGFAQSGGTWNGSTATTTIQGNFTISGGTYNAATTTYFAGSPMDTWTIDVPASITFHNYTENVNFYGPRKIAIASGDTVIVEGYTNIISGYVQTGTLEIRGNAILQSIAYITGSTIFGGSSTSGLVDQTLTLVSSTGNIDGDITVNKSSGSVQLLSALVMNASNQDLTITSGTLDINGNNLTVNGTSGKLIVGANGNLQLQGGETITANTNYPELQTGSTVTYNGSSSYTIKDYTYNNLTIAGSGSFAANSTQTLGGDFNLASGTFTAPSGNFNIAGDFNNTGGTFTHNSGSVILNGTDQSITGTNTFNNLTKNVTSAATLTFASSTTQTIVGTMDIQGAVGNLLSLRSDSSGTQWNIDPQGTRTISYLDVKDSNNVNATKINAVGTNSKNSRNNTNWIFDPFLIQTDYRFYKNADSLHPSTSLGGQSTATTIYSTSTPARLRMNVLVDSFDLSASLEQFKLQVSNSTTTGWTDVETFLGTNPPSWWNNSWRNRRKITFNNSASSENLTNFPVLVVLDSTNINYSKTQDSGQDIRFVDSNNLTELNYEIEKWDETGTSTVWVKVPQIDSASTTDFIWMYYNNTSATDNSTTTGVWDSNYVLVQHLKETSGTVTYDSTINGNNGTKISATEPLATSTGKINGAQYFDGSNDKITHSSGLGLSNRSVTISVWAYIGSTSKKGAFVKVGNDGNGYGLGIGSGNFDSNGNELIMLYEGARWIDSNTNYGTGWHKATMVINSSGVPEAFIDGASIGSFSGSGPSTPTSCSIGGYSTRLFSGVLDEVRLSSSTRSASWIKAEYLTENNQFNTFSSEETVGSDAWLFYDNSSVNSGDSITASLLSTSNVYGTYQEDNPTPLNPFEALAGQFIEYDFALDVSNLVEDTDYYFRMTEDDGTALDTYTYYPSVKFMTDNDSPTAGSLSVDSTSATSLTPSISGASDSGSGLSDTPYIFYNITAGTNSGAVSNTSWISDSLTPNTSYTFETSVTDASGNTATTSTASGYTQSSIPANFTATVDSTTQITTSWTANNNPAGTEYYVSNDTSSTNSGWITDTTYAFTGLTCGTSYSFSVKSKNADNLESAAATITQTTSACPPSDGGNRPPGGRSNGGGWGSGGGGVSTTTLDVCPLPLNNAFTACYYKGQNFKTLVAVEEQKKLDFDWDIAPVGQIKKGENFSATWQGNFNFKNKVYAFKVNTDDGMRLYIDGELVLDKWFDQKNTVYKFNKTLSSGSHLISVEYYQNTGKAIAKLSWKEIADVVIPPVEPPVTPPVQPPPTNPENPPATSTATTTPETPTTPVATSTIPGIVDEIIDTGGEIVDTVIIIITETVNSASDLVAAEITFIVSSISNTSKALASTAGNVISTVIEISRISEKKLATITVNSEISAGVNTLILAPSSLALQYSITTGGLLVGVQSLSDLWFLLIGLFHGLLTSLGLRSRRRYWGTVYDSKTKQPIDPAIVELVEANTDKVLEQSVTDLSGRFGFLDRQGKFYIRARKTHYTFPSTYITGTTDSIFENVYHGELIEITKPEDLISPNIPMDQIAFDWNQQEKQKIIKFHPSMEIAIQIGLNVLFWLGFAFIALSFILNTNLLHGIFVSLYALLALLKRFIPSRKLWGRIVSSKINTADLLLELSPKQLPQVIVARAMTANGGKFFLKTSKGEYVFRVKKIEGSNLNTIFESEIRVGVEGVVNDVINL